MSIFKDPRFKALADKHGIPMDVAVSLYNKKFMYGGYNPNNIDVEAYLKRLGANNKPLFNGNVTAADIQHIQEIIKKESGKDVTPEFIISQAQMEGGLTGTGRSHANNPFNVGEYDTHTEASFGSKQSGIEAYAKLLANDYLSGDRTEADLLKSYVNTAGSRYASAEDYEKSIQNQMDFIRKKYKKSGELGGGFGQEDELVVDANDPNLTYDVNDPKKRLYKGQTFSGRVESRDGDILNYTVEVKDGYDNGEYIEYNPDGEVVNMFQIYNENVSPEEGEKKETIVSAEDKKESKDKLTEGLKFDKDPISTNAEGFVAMPSKFIMPPQELESASQFKVRLSQLTPTEVSTDRFVQGTNDALAFAEESVKNLPENLKRGIFAQYLANAQESLFKQLGQVETMNLKEANRVGAMNARTLDNEEMMNINQNSDFERRQLIGKAKTDMDIVNYFKSIDNQRIGRYKDRQTIQLLNSSSENFEIDGLGQIVLKKRNTEKD
jgi:hypothetical protein